MAVRGKADSELTDGCVSRDVGTVRTKRKRETDCLSYTSSWGLQPRRAPTGNQTGDLLAHRWAFNPLSHTSQGTKKKNVLNGFIRRLDTAKDRISELEDR